MNCSKFKADRCNGTKCSKYNQRTIIHGLKKGEKS